MVYRRLYRLSVFATLLAAVVVMLGAWTRLVDAGLGCPDWPGCYGFLTVPTTPEAIAIAEARFPASPVEVEKGWPEMIHRYFASTLGLVILIMSAFALRAQRQAEQVPLKHVLGLLVLVICQGMFGMWTVTLNLWPQVVSAHLMGGFATLSLLFLLVLRTRQRSVESHVAGIAAQVKKRLASTGVHRRMKHLVNVGLVLVLVQLFLGAWTASNYAALACGSDFPDCQQSYWPDMDFKQGFNFMQEIGPNYLGGLFDNEARTAIQVTHRLGAAVVTIFLLGLLAWYWRHAYDPRVSKAAALVLLSLCIQVGLGISNVIWLIPLSIAVAHNAFGAVMLLALINLCYQLRRIEQ